MRILCLHGMGTSSGIFEAQVARIRGPLKKKGHELYFVDGALECETTKEITAVFPAPYLCYYPLATYELVTAAQARIAKIIETEGPFDGVMGFSQGAALGSSMILERQKTDPEHPLFKFAIFVAATLPFNKDDRGGNEAWAKAVDGTGPVGEFSGEVNVENPIGMPTDATGLNMIARYHPDKIPEFRVRIPTLHVVGKQDIYETQSRLLARLCTTKECKPKVVEHEDGHRFPSDGAVMDKIGRMLNVMIDKVKYSS